MNRLARIEDILWTLLLLAVPVSATPLIPFGSGTLVRPLAMVPAALLLLCAAFRIIFLRQWPKLDGFQGEALLLAIFVAYVAVSGLTQVAFLPEEPFKGQTPFGSLIRGLTTLLGGIAFYLIARLRIRAAVDIQHAIRLLFLGMSASIALAVIQVSAIVTGGQVLRAVQSVTDAFAVHYDGLVSRAQGMTFEPSWLATQIIVLLMPPLIARSISGQEAAGIPKRTGHRVGLAAGFAVAIAGLLCAGSRFGLVCLVLMVLLSALLAARRGAVLLPLAFAGMLAAGGAGLIAMSQIGAGAGASYVLGPVRYLTTSASLDAPGGESASDVSDVMAMAGRLSAAEAAFRIWLDHPAFGVSLGNGYRYFGRFAPDWAYATQLFTQGAKEGVGWLDPNSPEKGNAKSLFLRLLSETGLIGFGIFTTFLIRQTLAGRAFDDFHATFRLATALALTFAFVNQDSFADPVFWIPIALCTAMSRLTNSQIGAVQSH